MVSENENSFKCDACGASFGNGEELQKHLTL
jgi:hypothetical protein